MTPTTTWLTNANPQFQGKAKLSAYVFVIQAQVEKIKTVLDILHPIFDQELIKGIFVPYSHKFSHKDNYRKCILMHNKYLDDHHVIPITGVNIRTMNSKNNGMKSVSESLFLVQIDNSPYLQAYSLLTKLRLMVIGIVRFSQRIFNMQLTTLNKI